MKKDVYHTNFSRPGRDLLSRVALHMAISFILDGSMAISHPDLTAQLRDIGDGFLGFFNSLLSMSERNITWETAGSDLFNGLRITTDVQLDQSKVSAAARLEPQHSQRGGLPVRASHRRAEFTTQLTRAHEHDSQRPDVTSFGTKTVKYFKRLS